MNRTHDIGLHTCVQRRQDLLAEELDEDLVMAHIESSKYYGLAKTGKRIWELVEQPVSAADLCRHLLAEYDVAAETCEQQTLAFLNELWREGLIQDVETTRGVEHVISRHDEG